MEDPNMEEWEIVNYSSCCLKDEEDDEDENEEIEKSSKLGWVLNRGLSLGKKLVITGVAISSVPLFLPPLVVISALGIGFSVPFGFVYASYACTEKLMSTLLPSPTPILGYDEEERVYFDDFEKEEREQVEDLNGGIEAQIELVDYGDGEDIRAEQESSIRVDEFGGKEGYGEFDGGDEAEGGNVDDEEIGGPDVEEMRIELVKYDDDVGDEVGVDELMNNGGYQKLDVGEFQEGENVDVVKVGGPNEEEMRIESVVEAEQQDSTGRDKPTKNASEHEVYIDEGLEGENVDDVKLGGPNQEKTRIELVEAEQEGSIEGDKPKKNAVYHEVYIDEGPEGENVDDVKIEGPNEEETRIETEQEGSIGGNKPTNDAGYHEVYIDEGPEGENVDDVKIGGPNQEKTRIELVEAEQEGLIEGDKPTKIVGYHEVYIDEGPEGENVDDVKNGGPNEEEARIESVGDYDASHKNDIRAEKESSIIVDKSTNEAGNQELDHKSNEEEMKQPLLEKIEDEKPYPNATKTDEPGVVVQEVKNVEDRQIIGSLDGSSGNDVKDTMPISEVQNVVEKEGEKDVESKKKGDKIVIATGMSGIEKDKKRPVPPKGIEKRGKRKTSKSSGKRKEQEEKKSEKISGIEKELLEETKTSSENDSSLEKIQVPHEKMIGELKSVSNEKAPADVKEPTMPKSEDSDNIDINLAKSGQKDVVLDDNVGNRESSVEKEPLKPVRSKEEANVSSDVPATEENYNKSSTVKVAAVTVVPVLENDNTEETRKLKEAEEQVARDLLAVEEKIWKEIDAIRVIVGFSAPTRMSYFEELKALYLFTGIEPPSSFTDPSDLSEFWNKLRFLKSVIGLK